MTPAIIVGQAVGDALGMPFEKPGDQVHRDLEKWDGEFWPGTYHKLPAGHWTDDTEMAECLARSLIENRAPLSDGGPWKFVGVDVARRYLAWSQATPHGMGATTKAAMSLLARGFPWSESGIHIDNPYSVGSGPAMRAAPIGACFTPAHAFSVCRDDARITHVSPEATASSYAVAVAVWFALNYPHGPLLDEVTRFLILAERCYGLEPTQVRQDLQRACIEQNKGTPVSEIAPTPFGRHGNARFVVATALYCAATTENFRQGVQAAVRLGGDTDTRAAITGAILGARFGLEGIPDGYKRGLHRFDDLVQLDRQLNETADERFQSTRTAGQFDLFMLRDKKTGRWHNYGGVLEWVPANHPQGGTIHIDRAKLQEFVDKYPKDVCDIEIVPLKAAW